MVRMDPQPTFASTQRDAATDIRRHDDSHDQKELGAPATVV
jgi:hypothetical protein